MTDKEKEDLAYAVAHYIGWSNDWMWFDDVLQEMRIRMLSLNGQTRSYYFSACKHAAFKFWQKVRHQKERSIEGIKNRDVSYYNADYNDGTLGYISASVRKKAIFGERHASVKYTDDEVAKMVELRNGGMKYREIGERFNISKQCVHDIIKRRGKQGGVA